MLRIAEYNKITGKKIDLKELEKFGFEVFNQSTARKIYYEHIPPVSMEDDTYFMIEHREIWFIENGAKESNEAFNEYLANKLNEVVREVNKLRKDTK